ncbi:MAG: hypothetical protein QOK36_218 [Gaiellales bacterium]|nr:hypothetical protein [Gaiellales bacterium]
MVWTPRENPASTVLRAAPGGDTGEVKRGSNPAGLNDAELAALRALQRGERAPPASSDVWYFAETANLVWIDPQVHPPAVRLTDWGRDYPTD